MAGTLDRMDDQLPPEDDPILADVWADMSATERLLYMVHEGEPVPAEVTEQVQQMHRDRYEES